MWLSADSNVTHSIHTQHPLKLKFFLFLTLCRYLTELLQERQKLGPFLQVMPNCCRLLNHEIRRVSSFPDLDRYEHGSPFRSLGQPTNGKLDLEGWSMMQAEENCHLQRASPFRGPSPVGWIGMPGLPNPPIVKKVIRLDVPVDKYPSVCLKSLPK
jgi:protein quaking